MATWPTWVQMEWRGLTIAPDPVVDRSEMDRGVPKQRRTASDQRHVVQMPLSFDTAAEISNFEDWVRVDLHAGQDWFDFPLPWRVGTTVQARIVKGQLGPLEFLNRTLARAKRTVTLEYWMPAW